MLKIQNVLLILSGSKQCNRTHIIQDDSYLLCFVRSLLYEILKAQRLTSWVDCYLLKQLFLSSFMLKVVLEIYCDWGDEFKELR